MSFYYTYEEFKKIFGLHTVICPSDECDEGVICLGDEHDYDYEDCYQCKGKGTIDVPYTVQDYVSICISLAIEKSNWGGVSLLDEGATLFSFISKQEGIRSWKKNQSS